MVVLFLNHKIQNCGVYQYGLRIFDILKKTQSINYVYHEIESLDEYNNLLSVLPSIKLIIYNYHCTTMSWLNQHTIQKKVKNISISHESPCNFFDINLDIDPNGTLTSTNIPIPRPIYENIDIMLDNYQPSTLTIKEFINYSESNIPIFGTFGFGFDNKGINKVISYVNEQYDEAIIKLVIPDAFFDPNRLYTVNSMVVKCKNIPIKNGIKLMFSHEFFTTKDILYFLNSNTINIFMYDEMRGRGISSTLDYALSVKKPLGISNSYMFRNIYSDDICLYKTSIKNCIEHSVSYCSTFLEKYSHHNVIKTFENIVKVYTKHEGDLIDKTYSQAYQDYFIIKMTNYKQEGTFLEIGSNHPITHNNTNLLRTYYNWKGIMVEYDQSFETLYKNNCKNSIYIIDDARNVNYKKLLDDNNFPKKIDYLQIDLDVNNRSTLDTLELLDRTVFDTYTFATVTFEHDIYAGNFFDTREKSRNIFKNRGYVLVFPDVSVFYEGKDCQFEDWYIHPTLIENHNVYTSLKSTDIKDILSKTTMNNMLVEVSIGELVDKYNILELKRKKIKNPLKIVEIDKELLSLKDTKKYIEKYEFFYKLLYYVNETIWVMTDKIKEMKPDSPDFSIISNIIFEHNQKRFRLKNFFNILCDSSLKEQKSYSTNCCKIIIENKEVLLDKISEFNYLLIEYDILYVETNDDLVDSIKKIFKAPTILFDPCDFQNSIDLKIYNIDLSIKDIFSFKPLSYICGGKLGDFIHTLSVVNEVFYNTGQKGCVYLSNYGDRFSFGLEKAYKDTYDIVASQSYISSYYIYKDESVDINLINWRHSPILEKKNWISIFSEYYNISWGKHKWLQLENKDSIKDKIFISTTPYRFPSITDITNILTNYKKDEIIFISQEDSFYEDFINRTKSDISFYKIVNFTEMCILINSCKLFIGNLSSPLSISYACHKPNIVLFNESCESDNIRNANICLL